MFKIYSYEDWLTPLSSYEYRDVKLHAAAGASAADYDGNCCFVWRQGVKHDCSKVMELVHAEDGYYINGYGETVCIEPDLVYPLVKSSMIKEPVISRFSKHVIVTQKKAGEDTSCIASLYPQTWKYLESHESRFSARRSSIYKTAPKYGMFGVGEYGYSAYKVCVSGFYKEPLFSVLFSTDGRPVMTDDTCYLICFSSYDMAYTAMLYLNSPRVRSFLKSISFADSKRPFSKKVLERLDFSRICADISYGALQETEQSLGLSAYLTKDMAEAFISLVREHADLQDLAAMSL